ncbi:MAG: DUF1552 domain-containing protein [Myxococcota bacterium]
MSSRRRFLQGATTAGAVSLALPLLPSQSRSQDPAFPLRLVIFFSGNGTIVRDWVPESNGGRLTRLSPILSPLSRHLEKLMVVQGLDIKVAKREYQPKGGFHAHERGLGAILTGQPLHLGPMEAGSGYAQGISVDQFLAQRTAGATGIPVLNLGLISRRHGNGWYNRDTMTYAGDDLPVFAESDGSKIFDEVFSGATMDVAALERVRARRQSVLDFVRADLQRLETRISREDQLRLAEHHTAFRTLEQQLSEPVASCGDFSLAAPGGWNDENNMTAIADFQIQQTVQALACDRTRIATMQFGKGLGGLSLRCIGMTDSWHGLSHEGNGNESAQNKLTQLNTYIAERFASLLDAMDAVPEGSGTLLDHSIVCWVNELGIGNVHDHDNVPVVMAGGGHGFFKTGGAHVELGDRPNNDWLVSLCHAFGQTDVTEFGLSELSNGPLTELHA